MPDAVDADLLDPTNTEDPGDEAGAAPEEGMGLCLSGGGYRAMLFHLGVLWRLNELGIVHKLERISSVSGGSITSAVLGLAWGRMTWQGGVATDFGAHVVVPIRRLAGETIDSKSVIGGIFSPGSSISNKVRKAYAKHLYGDATLQDLPDDATGPRFVFNATSVQTATLWRFSRPYMANYRVGRADKPKVRIADVVTASSAFPPVLSPATIDVPPGTIRKTPGATLTEPPYTTKLVLTDGGVYDNLGLETVWKRYRTVLVSDGGGHVATEKEPKNDWVRHSLRMNAIIDSQVRALRKRQVVGSLEAKQRTGAYWRMRGRITDYTAPDKLDCPHERTMELARIETRLEKMPSRLQERVINWGYALADAAIRSHVVKDAAPPSGFPYQQSGV